MKEKRIYLVRHCSAAGQEPDAALTEEGTLQAEALIDYFANKPIGYIVSSPFVRATSTIRPFADEANLPILMDPRLRERILSSRNLPDWHDRLRHSFDNIELKLEGGESSQAAMERGIGAIEAMFARSEDNMIAVTHGNLLSLILKHYDNKYGYEAWKNLTNPDIYELTRRADSKHVTITRVWG